MLRGLLSALKISPAAPPASGPKQAASSAVLEPLPAPHDPDPYAAAAAADQRGDTEGATAVFRAHLDRHPDDISALATLGGRLLQLGQVEAAEAVLLPALRRFPAASPLLVNAGRAAQERMDVDRAIHFYRLALAADPGLAIAHFLLAVQLLLKGEYREGFIHLRARAEVSGADPTGWPREIPRWEGQSLIGKRLLVWLDWGGLGDELQFARYLAPLARDYQPARLVFCCRSEGRRLYAQIPGVDAAIAELKTVEADYQIALMDLPIIYATSLDNMLPATPYLAAPAAESARWAERLSGMSGRRIGLCWSSGYWGGQRSEKALPLACLTPLAALPNTHLISLQKGPGRDELPCAGLMLYDFDTDLGDLADTAALIQNLDLVISVDTSVAHLAGALGKPVLMLLKRESGNFWLLDREDSPWYPSMQIIRQSGEGGWESVVQGVVEKLTA